MSLGRYEDDDRSPRGDTRAVERRRTGYPDEALTPEDAPRRPWWRRFMPLIILVGAIGIFMVLRATQPTLTPEPPEERSWTVRAAAVTFTDIQPQLQVFGEVVAGRKVELRALVAGEILETGENFREGGIVSTGDTLVRIDPFDYEAARDDAVASLAEGKARLAEIKARAALEDEALANARQQLTIRQRDLNRAVRLSKSGNISQATVDDRRLAVAQQQAQVDQRESNVAQELSRVEQQEAVIQRLEVALRRAERDLGNTRIVAPFTGFVGSVAAEQGKRVGLNDRLADLTDADRLEARFTLTDAQYGRIIAAEGRVTGRPATVLWRVGGRTLEYTATIERVGAEISAASGGVEAFARLETKGTETPLRPGAFVEVRLPDTRYTQVALLPETALFDGDTIYAIVDGRLEPRKVEVATRTPEGILVSGNLAEGDQVLVTRFNEAGPGVRVDIQSGGA
ncbi:efflux RND transporter periplasmic adaptor subunit [Pyruvatibacter mobilis]|uniref:efflux RND transporter periplasmic adaptor subunit n=1 Tax=Pyruvatibacter mobilis TaxID=1712261 RepID=UPI003BAFAFAD